MSSEASGMSDCPEAKDTFEMESDRVVIRVQCEKLRVKTLNFPFLKGQKTKSVCIDKHAVEFSVRHGEVTLGSSTVVEKDRDLVIQL